MRLPSGPLRLNPENPFYPLDAEGKGVYLTGSHTWAVMQDMWLEGDEPIRTDYPALLDMMRRHGHNFLRFWSWMQFKYAPWNDRPTVFEPSPFARVEGHGEAVDGGGKFDLARWNDAYFERLHERVMLAGEHGIYVGVMLFEGWGIKHAEPGNNPWDGHPMNTRNNVNGVTDDPVGPNGRAWDFYSLHCPELLDWQRRYVRKVVETLNDLPHVLFEICNEVPWRPESMAWSQSMVDFIREVEAGLPNRHLVGIIAEGGDEPNEVLYTSNADWISPSNGRCFEQRYNPPADPRKLTFGDTDHLWGHGTDLRWVWKAFCRGQHVLFMDPWQPIPGDLNWWFRDGVPMNRRDYHAWAPTRRNLGLTREVAALLDLNRARPLDAFCTSTFALGVPGETYVVYLPSGPEAVGLWNEAGSFSVTYLDPATSVRRSAAPLTAPNRHVLEPPFVPAVAVLQRSP